MLLGYYFLPELFWQGPLPSASGRSACGSCAWTAGPADTLAIAIRTLLRMIDFVPGLFLGGFLVCWITGPAKRQRLGDLAADTTVVEAPRRLSRR